MKENRIKTKLILENHLPSFVRDEYPLFVDFLKRYYESLEYQGAPKDIIENIDEYIKLDKLTKIEDSTKLITSIEIYDISIQVESVKGFPSKSGLIQIGDEIIYYEYKDKEKNTFERCVRGFSGRVLKENGNDNELVFNSSFASQHLFNSEVKNINVTFLKIFFDKIKKQFIPGFDNRELYKNLDQNIFIKQAKNFYSSKGTPNSFNILFKALYGVDVDVINPYDFVIKPSNADYKLDKVITVEVLSGDPSKILNKTLYQDQYKTINQAFGTINNVVKISEDNREYYTLSIDNVYQRDVSLGESSIFGTFTVHPSTHLINSAINGDDTLDVDSTIGFPESGTLYYITDDNLTITIDYESKSVNQFFGCKGIFQRIESGTRLTLDTFAYVYGDDEDDLITLRITGILSDLDYKDDASLLFKNDSIEISTLGYNNEQDFRTNNWLFNLSTKHQIREIKDNRNFNYELITYDPINILNGDRIVLNGIIKTSFGELQNVTRIFEANPGSNPENSVRIVNDSEIVFVFYIQRELRKVPGLKYNSNVQNTYVDSEKNTYVASPSLPHYYNENFDLKNRIATFDATLISDETIPVFNHGFLTGDAVVYFPGDASNTLNIPKSVYFVKKIDNDRIKLSKSRSDIFKNIFLKISGTVTNNLFALLEFTEVDQSNTNIGLKFREIESQNIIRKIENPKSTEFDFKTPSGKIGILANGVEILNYKSNDFIKYGPLKEIIVSAAGQDYDVINSPKVKITDQVGFGASAFCRVSGTLKRIDIINSGLDYSNPPFISISGGGGEGAIITSNLVSYKHKAIFNASSQAKRVDIDSNIITFSDYHKFKDGEKIVYNTQGGLPLGGLVNNSVYYVSIIGSKSIRLHRTFNDAISATPKYDPNVGIIEGVRNEINITSNGSGNHILETYNKRKRLGGIRIINPGEKYLNKKSLIKSNDVNIYSNIINLKNHGYNDKDLLLYESSNPIGGLENLKSYYLTKIDENNIRLSEIADDEIGKDYFYENKIYVDFTSTGTGVLNYLPIKLNISGNIGISSYYFTGISTSANFNAETPNIIGINTSNIEIGNIINELNGFIGPNTKVTSIGIETIGISTSHLISEGISTQIITFSEFLDFDAKLIPVFRGEIDSVVLENSGNNYGSPEILNYDRQPVVELISGFSARAVPIIADGSIVKVLMQNFGDEYNSQPNIEIIGDGVGAQLSAVIKDGKIIDIFVVTGGIGYSKENTKIIITNSGIGAKFDSKITSWNINSFTRLQNSGQISSDGGVITKSNNGLQYTHIYPPSILRSNVYSERDVGTQINYQSDFQNDISNIKYHSPIIGWAYDGNPIYGPYGYTNPSTGGIISQMRSGYVPIRLPNRPPNFPSGFFVEDFQFTNTGTLDTHNGRFCKTPEFPNGVYAYFLTLTPNIIDSGPFSGQKQPQFPYLIGNSFKALPIDFNFSNKSNQKDFDLEQNNLIRNTLKYNLISDRSDYPYVVQSHKIRKQPSIIRGTSSGSVDSINIISGGKDYKVNDKIIFNNSKTEGGFGSYAIVSEIEGKNITKIESSSKLIKNVEVIQSKDSGGEYILISKDPHELQNNEIITISGVNTESVSFKSYNIKILGNNLQLRSGVGTIFSTGIVTHFDVSGRLSSPFLIENDFYMIGNEVIKILEVDQENSKIKVLRGQNDQDGPHFSGQFLIENSRKFTIFDDFQSYPYVRTVERYFNPEFSLSIGGVGITSTIFLNLIKLESSSFIETGSSTIVYFINQNDILQFRSGGHINLSSELLELNVERSKIISVGTTSITIDFDSSLIDYNGELCSIDKWNTVTLDSSSIYLPKHGYRTGQILEYNSNEGEGILVSSSDDTQFNLEDSQRVFAARINENVIGLSTTPIGVGTDGSFVGIGITTGLLYFVGFGTGIYHSFKTLDPNTVKVDVNQNLTTIFTDEIINLKIGDIVTVSSIPENKINYPIIYDETNRVLVTKISSFTAEDVETSSNSIIIQNHDYYDGEKIIHKSQSPVDGLKNNEIYYITVVDSDRIRLSTSFFRRNESIVRLTSVSFGTISSINPKIKVTKGQTISFNLSDSSLSYFRGSLRFPAFTFDIFSDKTFKTRFTSSNQTGNFEVENYGIIGISTDARTEIKSTDDLPSELYYKLSPVIDPSLPISKSQIIISDEGNFEHSTIKKIDSKFSGSHSIVAISSTSFSYNIKTKPESSLYKDTDGIFKYYTKSVLEKGPIHKIQLVSEGQRFKKLPFIDRIITDSGRDAILFPESKSIGKLLRVSLTDPGYDYPSDKTLRPKSALPQILKLDPLASFVEINIISEGINYSRSPNLIVKDGYTNKIIDDVNLSYETGDLKVKIVKNTKGIYDVTPIFIPINNSNGIPIRSIIYDEESGDATLTLGASYSSIEDFPFRKDDRFLLENIITNNQQGFVNRGYNSSSYEYKLFTVKSFDANIGGSNATIVFNLSDFLRNNESPGIFSPINSISRIVPEKYFPKFDAKLQRNNFFIGENIKRISRNKISIFGKLEDWDLENQFMKVSSSFVFSKGDLIKGDSSESQAVITEVKVFDSSYITNSTSLIERGWNKNTGFLNDSLQRIHDNDYYQALSYAIKSPISFDIWDDAVSSLAHPSGFRKFSDFSIDSKIVKNINIDVRQTTSSNNPGVGSTTVFFVNSTLDVSPNDIISAFGIGSTDSSVFGSASVVSVGGSFVTIAPTICNIRTGVAVSFTRNVESNSGIKTDQSFGSFDAQVFLSEIIDTSAIFDFDLATEESFNIDGKNVSENINLNSQIIQDYSRSVGNKVLVIDDIASEFNSEPRISKFGVVNKFRLSDFRSRKYIMGIRDKRFTGEKQILLISMIQNGREIYLNQYGRIDTVSDLGFFDAQIQGEEVSLLFYPNKFEFNDYDTSFISFDITDVYSSGDFSLGSAVNIVTEFIDHSVGIAKTTVFSMPKSFRASKILIQFRRSTGEYEFDEISLVHDDSNVEIIEYGQLSDDPPASPFSGSGFGTYYPYIEGQDVKIDFIPFDSTKSHEIKTFSINISSSNLVGIASTTINTGTVESFNTNIESSLNPNSTIVAQYSNYKSGITSEGIGAYIIACVSDNTNNKHQISELCVSSEDLYSSVSEFAILQTDNNEFYEKLGVFESESDGNDTYIKFTPIPNIDVNVKIFQTSIKIPITFYELTRIDI